MEVSRTHIQHDGISNDIKTVRNKSKFTIRRFFLRLPKMFLYCNEFSNRLETVDTTDTKLYRIDHGLSGGRILGFLRERIICFNDLIRQRSSSLFMEVLCYRNDGSNLFRVRDDAVRIL